MRITIKARRGFLLWRTHQEERGARGAHHGGGDDGALLLATTAAAKAAEEEEEAEEAEEEEWWLRSGCGQEESWAIASSSEAARTDHALWPAVTVASRVWRYVSQSIVPTAAAAAGNVAGGDALQRRPARYADS